MYSFSNKSKIQLATCHQKLQMICFDAIGVVDFSVICGHRGKEEQNKAFKDGYSKMQWGESQHNTRPSRAVDLLPYPTGWDDREKFFELAGVIKGIAFKHNIEIKWGGDFKGFFDGAHFELVSIY